MHEKKIAQLAAESARPAAHAEEATEVLEQVWNVLNGRVCTTEVHRLVRHLVLSHALSARCGCNWEPSPEPCMTTNSRCTWCTLQQSSSRKHQHAIVTFRILADVAIISLQVLRPPLDNSTCNPAGINTPRPSVRLR